MKIQTFYTLKKGEKKVEVHIKLKNEIEDHRLRVLFDTDIQAEYADAAGHFCVDHRPLLPLKDADGYYYNELVTQPMQSFVDLSDGDNGFGIVNDCMTEYEAMKNTEGTLALTLFRAVRNIICTEMRSAGAFPNQKGGQCLREMEYHYALVPHKGNWQQAELFYAANRLNVPAKPAQFAPCEKANGKLPAEHSFYSVSNLQLSAIKKSEDGNSVIVRLFNPSDKTVKGCVWFAKEIHSAYYTNLNEENESEAEVHDNTIAIELEQNKICTLKITF